MTKLYVLGIPKFPAKLGGNNLSLPIRLDERKLCELIWFSEHLFLSPTDLRKIIGDIYSKLVSKITLRKRVVLALRAIGKPCHYSEVLQYLSEFYPDKEMTGESIRIALASANDEVVWVGMKGTYALSEWGFSRPKIGLIDTVSAIVESRFKVTGKPVHIDYIASQICKYRPMVNPNSVRMAAIHNSALCSPSKDYYLPVNQKSCGQLSIDPNELDDILRNLDAS